MLIAYILCTIGLCLLPMLKSLREHEARVYDQRLREVRLSWVQKYYPDLRKMTWDEIEKEYSVRRLYDEIR